MIQQIFLIILCFGIISEGVSFSVTKKEHPSALIATVPIDVQSSEERVIAEINRIRLEKGLNPLKMWPELVICAREHSQNMSTNKCPFGHDGFEQRANEMEKIAYMHSIAENVAYSYNYNDPVKVAIDGWMKSGGHRKNILGDYEETGVGVAISEDGKFFITQLFAKRYN